MTQQIYTHLVSTETIMRTTHFGLGVLDVRAGLPPRAAPATWDTNAAWNYERGRCWATVAPRCMPLKINGKINPAAVALARQDGVMI
jgi:hypothetical protein